MADKAPSRSKALGISTIFTALLYLKSQGGEASFSDVVQHLSTSMEFDSWARESYEKTGYTRWRSIMHFHSITLVKAGFLVKKQGIWYLTPEGENALKLGPEKLYASAKTLYKEWSQNNQEIPEESVENTIQSQEVTILEYEERALEGLKAQVNLKNAYAFQDFVAALLRGMGYFTPFVAPKGKDGGVDVIAYRDPLGSVAPRIRVQVKHRDSSATQPEIQQLHGLLRDSDVGIFVSSGGFTADAKNWVRNSARQHIEIIDFDKLISLWIEFYPKLNEDDRNLLPLKPIYFFNPSD